MQAINATRSFKIASTWGYKDPKTGNWNGMTGDLVRKDVDIAGIYLMFSSLKIDQSVY